MKMHLHIAVIQILLAVAPAFSLAENQVAEPSLKPTGEEHPISIDSNGLKAPEPPTKCMAAPNATTLGAPHIRTNPDCLAAFYDFNDFDPETGCTRDKSGNGFDLVPVGNHAATTDGIAGKGVLLNGGSLQAKGNPLAGADYFTISVWFKTAEPMNNYKLLSAAVWHGGNNASGWNVGTHYSEFWADNHEGSLRGEPNWKRNTEFRKDAWNHLVLTYDGSHVREYINGELSVNVLGTGLRVGDGAPMTVGAWMGGFQFHGVLDELRIYRRALKEPELQALHRVATGPESAIPAAAQKPIADNDTPLRLVVDLSDGSQLIGVSNVDSFSLVTPYAQMKILLKQSTAIRLNDDHETVTVEMRNGDRLKGSLSLDAFKLQTIFGVVSVDLNRIRSLKVLVPETVPAKG